MVSLFKQGVPAEKGSIQSSEIRGNFEALYDKVRALEVRAEETPSTSVVVEGGNVYFRSSSTNQLKLVQFYTKVYNIANEYGYQTIRNQDGTLSRLAMNSRGPSNFQSQGAFIEVLISIDKNGTILFTESLKPQNEIRSAPYNIYFDDSEIPLSLIFLEKNTNGILQPIRQEYIYDRRPFVTTAFQNNQTATEVEQQVEDNKQRIEYLEETTAGKVANFRISIPNSNKLLADGTSGNNRQFIVNAGTAVYGSTILKFAGGRINFSSIPSTTRRVFNAFPVTVTANYYVRCIIGLQYNPSAPNPLDENSTLVFLYGTPAATIDSTMLPPLVGGVVPLYEFLYRINQTATDIYPVNDFETLGSEQVSFEFPLVELVKVPGGYDAYNIVEVDLSDYEYTSSYVENMFQPDKYIDIFDDQNNMIRRYISSVGYSEETKIAQITVDDSFTDISLLRNPKVRAQQHWDILKDIRPFIGI
jgi:hypothetical protein